MEIYYSSLNTVGYDFMWANISSYDFEGDRIYWNKVLILKDALVRYPKAKWIWWMDIDIIIMNMNLDMHTHLLSPEAMTKQLVYDKPINKPGGGPSVQDGSHQPKWIQKMSIF